MKLGVFEVFEVDYHDRAWSVGKAETLKDAKRIARAALKKSGGEFPTFIVSDGRCVG